MSYSIVVADPPWPFKDKLAGPKRGAAMHYKLMSMQDIYDFPKTRELVFAPDALLFMWRVASMVPEAMATCKAWGFVPKSEIVWVKTSVSKKAESSLAFGMGRYVRNCHEVCIIAARPKAVRLIEKLNVRSVFFAPVGKHSAKPQAFYDLVENLTGEPNPERNIDIFGRKKRSGWTVIGDEVAEHAEVGE